MSVADLFGRVALARVGEAVVVGELGGVALAQVGEAVIVGELCGADDVGDAGQQPADVDGGDLAVVAGGDDLAASGFGDPLEGDERPGVTHRGLVEDDHAAGG